MSVSQADPESPANSSTPSVLYPDPGIDVGWNHSDKVAMVTPPPGTGGIKPGDTYDGWGVFNYSYHGNSSDFDRGNVTNGTTAVILFGDGPILGGKWDMPWGKSSFILYQWHADKTSIKIIKYFTVILSPLTLFSISHVGSSGLLHSQFNKRGWTALKSNSSCFQGILVSSFKW